MDQRDTSAPPRVQESLPIRWTLGSVLVHHASARDADVRRDGGDGRSAASAGGANAAVTG